MRLSPPFVLPLGAPVLESSEVSAPTRLTPAGRGGASAMLTASSCVVGGVAAAVLVLGPSGPLAWAAVGVSSIALGIYGWLWVRIAWVGVWVSQQELVVRGWWRSQRFARSELARFSSASYTGWFYNVGWPVAAGAFEPGVLQIWTLRGEQILLPSSVTWRSTATRQAARLNDWLGVDRPRGRMASRGEK